MSPAPRGKWRSIRGLPTGRRGGMGLRGSSFMGIGGESAIRSRDFGKGTGEGVEFFVDCVKIQER
ncbi:MAG: hypothetical protein R2741_02465 [Methanolobus sp.]